MNVFPCHSYVDYRSCFIRGQQQQQLCSVSFGDNRCLPRDAWRNTGSSQITIVQCIGCDIECTLGAVNAQRDSVRLVATTRCGRVDDATRRWVMILDGLLLLLLLLIQVPFRRRQRQPVRTCISRAPCLRSPWSASTEWYCSTSIFLSISFFVSRLSFAFNLARDNQFFHTIPPHYMSKEFQLPLA